MSVTDRLVSFPWLQPVSDVLPSHSVVRTLPTHTAQLLV